MDNNSDEFLKDQKLKQKYNEISNKTIQIYKALINGQKDKMNYAQQSILSHISDLEKYKETIILLQKNIDDIEKEQLNNQLL